MNEINKQRAVLWRLALSVKDRYINDVNDEILKAADYALNHCNLRDFKGSATPSTTYSDYISFYQLIYYMFTPSLPTQGPNYFHVSRMAPSILNTSMSDSVAREITGALLEMQLISNHVLETIRIERERLMLRS